MAKKQTICGHEIHHSMGLCRSCYDHGTRLPEGANYAPATVDPERVAAAADVIVQNVLD